MKDNKDQMYSKKNVTGNLFHTNSVGKLLSKTVEHIYAR